MKPYYYVYRYQDRAPVVRHATLESAQAEAERLATQHPGAHIEILKAVAISKIYGPASTFFVDGEGPEFEKRRANIFEALCPNDQSEPRPGDAHTKQAKQENTK